MVISLAALGIIGPSVSYAIPRIKVFLDDNNSDLRAVATIVLGNMGSKANMAIPSIAKLLKDKSSIVRDKACEALGNIGPGAYIALPDLLYLFNEGQPVDKVNVARAVERIAGALHDADGVYAKRNLEQALTIFKKNDDVGIQKSTRTVQRAVKYLSILNEKPESTFSEQPLVKIRFEHEIPSEIMDVSNLMINGNEVTIKEIGSDKKTIYYLGEKKFLRDGLNYLKSKEKQLRFWCEDLKLKNYEIPYENSYAIIAAIDDYSRKNDPDNRDTTGYLDLNFMVQHANRLVDILKNLGFPENNIFQFYNEKATSTALERALKEFWRGATYSNSGRLIFYFGGHGNNQDGSSYLVTYDHDELKPTLTSLLMSDLTGRHFENTTAHHMLVLLDSCSSGLALPKFQSVDVNEERLKTFRNLSIIKGETNDKARNILVAGTGEQKALWENGGIFTQALNFGLEGNADLNDDKIIQFSELSLFVKNRVRVRANQTGVEQLPDSFTANKYGNGNIIFIRPARD